MENIVKLLMAMVFVIYTTSVSAIPSTTVGGVDTLVDYSSLGNSGDAGELQFFADYLNVDPLALTLEKVNASAGDDGNWMEVTGDASDQDLWAFDFTGLDPSLFLVKTGENTGLLADNTAAVYDSFLYSNVDSLGYAVIDLNIFTKINPGNGPRGGEETPYIDIFRVSHISVTDVKVPEPGMIGLLAIGILGVVVAYRKKNV